MRVSISILTLSFAMMAALGASPAFGQQAEAPWLWAAPALYGFEEGACDPGKAQPDTQPAPKPMIDPLFCPSLGQAQRQQIGAAFAQSVAAHFAHVEPQFGQHLPSAATPSAKLRGTLAVSLRLTRASYATVVKPAGIDAYLPVTLTLDITNPATGEVVFTRTRNAIGQGTYSAQTLEPELARQFPAHLTATMQALVAEAGAVFRPYAQSAKVLGAVTMAKGDTGYVIDKGRTAGLRAGDGINGDGAVVYAGPDYAVVRASLSPYREGQQLSRMATAPVETLARPTVLVAVEQGAEGYEARWAGQILEDALGSGNALSPVPVNAAFVSLRRLALNDAGTDLAADERSLPDYVASVRIVVLDPVRRPSEIPGVSVERHEALAFVTLVDASGRAVGAWQGRGLIEDKVSGDIRFSEDQRREAVLRNALADAAQKMAAFRPQPRLAPLTRKGGAMVLDDPGGAVRTGVTLSVLRPAGRFKGVAGDVFVPAGEVSTREAVAGGVIVTDAGVSALNWRGGEVVALEAAGVPTTMRQSIGQCLGADGVPVVEDRGQVPMLAFAPAAASLLAGRMPAAVRVSTLPARLAVLAPSFADWGRFAPAAAVPPDACFVPVIAVKRSAAGYQVTVGYALHQDGAASGAKIGASGLATALTPTRLPAGSDAQATAAMLQSDLAAQVLPVAASAAAALKPAS